MEELKLTEKDIEIIGHIATRVELYLENTRKKYPNPKDYSKKVMGSAKLEDRIVACAMLLGFRDVYVEKYNTPGQLAEIASSQLQNSRINDVADVFVKSLEGIDSQFKIDYKIRNRAIEELDRAIGLENKRGKDEIKKVAIGYKIELSGKPSVYKFPSDAIDLKKVLSNPKAIELIIRILTRSGLVEHLAFLLETSYFVIRCGYNDSQLRKYIQLFAKSSNQLATKEVIDSSIQTIISLDEHNLKPLAESSAKIMVSNPDLYTNLLLAALMKLP